METKGNCRIFLTSLGSTIRERKRLVTLFLHRGLGQREDSISDRLCATSPPSPVTLGKVITVGVTGTSREWENGMTPHL